MSAKGTAVAETATAEVMSPEEAALLAQQNAEFDNDSVSVPILKIGQALTREVQDEQAEAGEFINTLTGEGIGSDIGFIVAYYQKGRSAADRKTNRYYVAFEDTIPERWADLVGEEWVGTPFSEYPDAEEQYKERVNNKEIEWGKGPLVSTTHNYTGFAIVSAVVDEDGNEIEPESLQPVRLSLQRTQMEGVRKINSLYRMTLRNRPFWDKVFNFTTYKKSFASGPAFLLKPSVGRDTTPEERVEARDLALAVAGGRVADNAEAAEKGNALVEPDAKGGLAV